MATTSACAVGSSVGVTWLTPVAMTVAVTDDHRAERAAAGGHVAGGQVDGGEQMCVRQQGTATNGHQVPVRCSGRTGTRVSARPVAARIAATIAGVDEMVGGSPTPRMP